MPRPLPHAGAAVTAARDGGAMNISTRSALVIAAALLLASCSTSVPGTATMAGVKAAPVPLAPPPRGSHGGMNAPSAGETVTGPASGAIRNGDSVSPLDEHLPAIAKLDPALITAVRAAARDAEASGVELRVTSGWRSADYQRRLLEDAIATYGSVEEARRLVSTPELSRHVTGEAIDIGPTAAADWLGRNGSDYGLCQVYANEAWHFELLAGADGVCPPLLPDASEG